LCHPTEVHSKAEMEKEEEEEKSIYEPTTYSAPAAHL